MIKKEIKYADKLYGQLIEPMVNKINSSEWVGKEIFPLQGSIMVYDKGKVFDAHKHKLNPRIISRTQEVFVVINGLIQITFYNEDNKKIIGVLQAGVGQAIFIWRGYHQLKVLKDYSVFYEIKSGQMTHETVSDDKEYL